MIENGEGLDESTDWCDVRSEEQRSSTDPCGTPYRHRDMLDVCRPSLTYCCRSARYERSYPVDSKVVLGLIMGVYGKRIRLVL